MGDVLSLIEQAERTMDADVVAESAGRMMSGTFTLDDFLAQLNQVRKMGSLGGLMKLMPGVTKEMRAAASNVDDRELDKVEAIIRSMTPRERREPVDHRRVAAHAHRARLGHDRRGGQPADEAVRRDAQDDATDARGRDAERCPGDWGGWRSWPRGPATRRVVPPGFEALAQGMTQRSPHEPAAEKQEEEGREGDPAQTTLNFDARVCRPASGGPGQKV